MTPQKQAARAEHKQRMVERRERQNARQPATVVMTRAEFRAAMDELRAMAEPVNKDRAEKGLPPMVFRRPTVQIIFATRYMPHQGLQERARRVLRMVGWDLPMAEAA